MGILVTFPDRVDALLGCPFKTGKNVKKGSRRKAEIADSRGKLPHKASDGALGRCFLFRWFLAALTFHLPSIVSAAWKEGGRNLYRRRTECLPVFNRVLARGRNVRYIQLFSLEGHDQKQPRREGGISYYDSLSRLSLSARLHCV